MYPDLAVRELVANALIHQDFSITGMGPTVEVFADRMEITNPGVPLVSTARFLDSPPRSRNESLASFMRLVGICEERVSGVDKVVFETEFYQLPAPRFETEGHATRVMLFAHRALKDMDRNDRIHACYMHACLRCVEQDPHDQRQPARAFWYRGPQQRHCLTNHSGCAGSSTDQTLRPRSR